MRTINIAYGEKLVEAIIDKDFDTASVLIKNGDGDIVGYSPFEDDIEELFQHIRGSFNFIEVSEKILKKVNDKL